MEKKTTTKKRVAKNEAKTLLLADYITRKSFSAYMVDVGNNIDARFEHLNNKTELRTQYQGWLVSPILWKRALAVYGHVLLVHAVFMALVFCFIFLFGL